MSEVVPKISSKRSTIASLVRQKILSGEWPPGMRLTEKMLCEQTDASRSSVRETLHMLLQEGFVSNEPNRGFRVATLDASEAADIYQVRSVLEGLAARNFVNMASKEERAALDDALVELEKAIAEEDVKKQLAAIDAFYRALLDGCYNEVLKLTLQGLHGKIARLRATSILSPGRIRQTLKEMQRIGEAIRQNDEDAAFQACVDHMRYTAAVAVRTIQALRAR